MIEHELGAIGKKIALRLGERQNEAVMIASKHIQFLLLCVGCILALYLGSNVVSIPIAGLMIILSTILILIWMLCAGVNWWVPLFAGMTILGVFHVGFKIYPGEVGVALCVLGLLPVVLAHDATAFQGQRKALPFIFYLTAGYIIIRLLIDIIPAAGERSSLARISFNYCWAFGFIPLFQNYGSFSAARPSILIMFSLLLVRAGAALVGFFANIPLYIPGINYVLSFSSEDSLISMRSVASSLLFCSLVLFHSTRSVFGRLLLLPIFGFSTILVVMGAGRFQAFVTLMLPIAFFAWSRSKILLPASIIIGISGMLVINMVPDSLQVLPSSAGRALSGLVLTQDMSTTFGTGGSNEWHDAMRAEGFRRWTQSPFTLLFGDGIKPSPDYFDTLTRTADAEAAVQNAANIGAYESGLWSVLAVVGLVGFVLYLIFVVTFLKEIIPSFLKKPKGTFWEAIIFWAVFSSVLWYLQCYFQGSPPGLDLLILVMAWNLVNEGKLEEEPALDTAESSYRRLPSAVLARSRG